MPWINEEIMLNEISQIKKYDYYMNSLTGGTWSSQINRDRKSNGHSQGLKGGRKWGVIV